MALRAGFHGTVGQPSAQVIDGSLKFDSAKKTVLHRTFSAGNPRTWTFSMWTRKQNADCHFLSSGTAANRFNAGWVQGTDKLFIYIQESSSAVLNLNSVARFRDNGWYHIVIAADTTNANNDDRIIVYVNGDRIYDWTGDTTINQNASTHLNNANSHAIGNRYYNNSDYVSGLIAQTYLIDGQALGPEYFGFTDPLTNTWRPKKFSGNYTIAASGVVYSDNGSGTVNGSRTYDKAFDGSTSTFCEPSDNQTVTFDFTSLPGGGITVGSSLRMYLNKAGTPAAGHFTVNGTNLGGSVPSSGWLTINSVSRLDTITFYHQSGSSSVELYAVEVDGSILTDGTAAQGTNSFYLPMDGNSPIGEDKSGQGNNWTPVNFGGSVELDKATGALPILNTTQGGTQAGVDVRTDAYAQGDPNNQLSRNYSSNTTATGGFSGSYPKTNLFDGAAPADGNRAEAASNDDPINITFDPPITVSSTISLWSGKSSTRYQINDSGTYTTYSDAVGSYKDISHSGSLSNIKILHGSAGQAAGISAIKIDGTQLIDSGLFLAVPLVGTTNDVSNQINSGSTTKIATSSSVNPSSTQSNFYGGSHHWSAASDTLQYAQQGNELVFGTGDYTIECWLYDDNGHNGGGSGRCYIFDNRIGGSVVGDPPTMVGYVDSHNEFNFYDGDSTITHTVSSTVGKWWHYAVTREGTTTRMFIDGILRGSSTSSTNFTNNGIGVGRATDGGYGWAGYIQDFRVYKGVAKYTSDFVPASTNPDILPDTPSGVSGGSKLTKITEGAVSFDATDDYLSMVDNSDFAFGTGDFTAECFIYPKGNANYRAIIDCRDQVSDPGGWILGVNANDQLYIYTDGFLLTSADTNTVTAENKWYHVAYVRNSGTHILYIDGREADRSSTSIDYDTDNCVIGASYAKNGEYWNGFISNVRLVKGTALYTSNFTPPSAPLTDVTNTKLLCCQSNTQAAAAAVSPNGTTVWSAGTLSGSIEAVRPWALGFDGSESTFTRPVSNQMASIMFDTPISFSSKFEIRGALDSGNTGSIEVYDGTDAWINVSSSFGSYSQASQYPRVNLTSSLTSPVKGIRFNGVSAVYQPRFTGIYVDDAVLVDPLTPSGSPPATNFNPFITDIHAVRGQETGYPTWNPLRVSSQTLSNNNMTTTGNSGNVLGSMFTPTSGKFYWEVTAGSNYTMTGIQRENNYDMSYPGNSTGQIALYLNSGMGSGQLYEGGSITSSWGGGLTGDVIGVALDMDNNKVYFYNNGRGLGSGGITGTPEAVDVPTGGGYTANCRSGSGGSDGPSTINFGQTPFKFPPPDGFQPINAANVRPETVITRPDQYVTATTYSGNGDSSGRHINIGFRPDLIWLKSRGSGNHGLYDSVRGPDKRLQSDGNAAEGTVVFPGASNFGFDFGSETYYNASSTNYVAWTWKAGGNKNTFNIDDVGYANASNVNMAVGDLNSSFYNTSETWSNGLSALSGSSLTNPPNGFNGDPDSYADSTNGWSLDLSGHTFGTGAHTIEVKSGGATSFSVGGATGSGSLTDPGGGGAKVWTGTYTGEINSITSSASGASVYYVKIDGKILVNSGTDLSGRTQYPSIAPTGCSVGTKQGFSIIRYQANSTAGATIPHGLSQAPTFALVKSLETVGSSNSDWTVFHSTLSGTNAVYLNQTSSSNSTGSWNNTNPDANVITLGTAHVSNLSPNHYIAYLWHDVPGLQKFGSFEGNGNADGPFVELGFKPAVIITKNIDNYGTNYDWCIYDNTRSTYNPNDKFLCPNLNNQENVRGDNNTDNARYVDFLSNGFKIRNNSSPMNLNAHTIIYAAWAETPQFNLYGGQSNAR